MKNGLFKIASVALLAFALTACGLGATPTPPPVANKPPTPVLNLPTAKPSDPCVNQYFPVKDNAVYTYSSTGSPSGPYSFTRTFSNVRVDGFTITSAVDKLVLPQEWSCGPQGLVADQLSVTDATSILALSKFTDLQATNVTGVVLPSAITAGQQWIFEFDIQGTEITKSGGNPAQLTGHIRYTYTAGDVESVTVPAGTFDAIAIKVETIIRFNITSGGASMSPLNDTTYTMWYAPGVGWVKSSGEGKLGGQDYFETIVLESYTLP